MKRLTNVVLIGWSIVAVVFSLSCIAHGDEKTYVPTDEATVVYEEAQRHRVTRGLARQDHDPGLASIAQRVANWMAHRGGMSHTSLGDNVVACGAGPRGMVTMWINSSGHRAFVLGGATKCGYGFATSKGGSTYAAGIFRSAAAEIQDPDNMSGIGGNGGGGGRRGFFRRR